jgi:hypothetical protein
MQRLATWAGDFVCDPSDSLVTRRMSSRSPGNLVNFRLTQRAFWVFLWLVPVLACYKVSLPSRESERETDAAGVRGSSYFSVFYGSGRSFKSPTFFFPPLS